MREPNVQSEPHRAIDAEGWLHTGNLGTMDARGYLKITGSVKEMIIRGGENLFPAEIENVMLEHQDVLEVAVVGIPDENGVRSWPASCDSELALPSISKRWSSIVAST